MKKKIVIWCIFLVGHIDSMQEKLQKIILEARLNYAIDENNPNMVRSLTHQGANIHATSPIQGLNMIHYAKFLKRNKCVEILQKAEKKGRKHTYTAKK